MGTKECILDKHSEISLRANHLNLITTCIPKQLNGGLKSLGKEINNIIKIEENNNKSSLINFFSNGWRNHFSLSR